MKCLQVMDVCFTCRIPNFTSDVTNLLVKLYCHWQMKVLCLCMFAVYWYSTIFLKKRSADNRF